MSIGPLRSSGLGSVNYPFPVFKFEHKYMGDSLPQSSFNTVFRFENQALNHHPFSLLSSFPARVSPGNLPPVRQCHRLDTVTTKIFHGNLLSFPFPTFASQPRRSHSPSFENNPFPINNHYLESVTVACRINSVCSRQQQYDIHVETAKNITTMYESNGSFANRF